MAPGSEILLPQEDGSDRDELKPTTHTLGLTRNYVPSWSQQDAFRELYQNWKDAIIFTFKLNQRSFKTEVVELTDGIQILVYHPLGLNRELLGYIWFKRKEGSVKITNFQAKLERRNLELGSSTKRGNNTMAGTHGEGLKLAALVLRRENRRVRITSSKYNWTFGFRGPTKSIFFCKLTPAPPTQLDAVNKILGNLKADPATDVSIVIDKGRDGKEISEEEFRTWLRVSLDVERPKDPTDIIETPQGDLILDENYAGKMYLKGLLLPSGGSTIKAQHAGYNLLHGQINRDRERLKNEDEESQTLMHIWEHAIETRGDKVLQRYISLLQENSDCVDVNRAERLISRRTALAIWERLKSQGVGKFYYDREESNPDIDIIKKSLKRQPAPLSNKLWRILSKYGFIRKPREEQNHLFRNSSVSDEPSTLFSINIQRGLSACLALHARTQRVQVEYVTGAETEVEMLFDKQKQLLKVHEKWLNFSRIHETTPCRASMLDEIQLLDSIFLCDHVIEELCDLAVIEIVETFDCNVDAASRFIKSMRIQVRENLQHMPREVSVQPSDEPRRLVVSWADNESERVRQVLNNGAYSALDLPHIAYFASPDLNGYVFTINEYVQVKWRPEMATGETTESVAFIHRILYKQYGDEKPQVYLLASRYSFLELFHLNSSAVQLFGPVNRKELLLHFTDFDTMGKRQDAELIPTSQIIEARNLEFDPAPYAEPVQSVAHAPADLDASGFYCRFALRSKVGNQPACITPLGSNLLRYHERWKVPRYYPLAKPVIIDFSPSVLGLAEGFSQEGFEVAAGIGFSTVHDMTWKTRYSSAEVYDGTQNDVLAQITNGQLAQPSWLKPGTAKVAVIGSSHSQCESDNIRKDEDTKPVFNHILQALQTVQHILSNFEAVHNPFDFLVCVLPEAALNPDVLPIFMQTVYLLLGNRCSVHIQKVQLPTYGILVDKIFIVILASPVCVAHQWVWDPSEMMQTTIGNIMRGLAFQNPRANHPNREGQCSFKCKTPSTENETIYNHDTNNPAIPGVTQPIEMSSTMALKIPLFRKPSFLHPIRNDLLTVREMARIFGFPDDFVFYDGPRGSHQYFSHAVPPMVAKIVARGVRGIIEQFQGRELGDTSSMDVVLISSRAVKRQRTE
ncbi:hypothetical protein TCE0_013f01201 [Talaromyces pinophilus]|uniref:DNA (cytosine-5-)-methyltransferase n=1 Tax=Talaromyces pinophilus TaxID=128442 RepID=A0A698XNK1_TALPI|nr:hypothetical protein TCE0_013f01201 [Talaromyces pinophilus]